MADIERKVAENSGGRFFVDETCIDCELCREIAPRHFVRQDDAGYSYVRNQPTTPEEAETCRDALGECPVEAIGDLED